MTLVTAIYCNYFTVWYALGDLCHGNRQAFVITPIKTYALG